MYKLTRDTEQGLEVDHHLHPTYVAAANEAVRRGNGWEVHASTIYTNNTKPPQAMVAADQPLATALYAEAMYWRRTAQSIANRKRTFKTK
tara:strand:- start:882 stop:1151 length:270 start_codon:yes stop_codon:yes gene_type:complete